MRPLSRLLSPAPVRSAIRVASVAAPLLLAYWPPVHGAEHKSQTESQSESQTELKPESKPASKPKIAIAAFGLYGDQNVFQSEATRAAKIVADRFGTSDVTVKSNTKSREDADADTIAATLKSMAADMDADGVLFVILTSHGSQAGLDVKSGSHDGVLTPLNLIKALDDAPARYRVVIISACYSGVFVRPIADPDTLVITAADADHSSFGCRNGNEWTYFGDALFNDALRHTANLRDAFATASAIVRRREHQRHLTPSNPQMSGGENVEHVLKGELDQIVAYSRDGSGLEPKYAFSRGVACGAKGDYAHAITAYSEAIKYDPKYPISYNNRGVAYFRTGDNDHAIADYNEAIRLNPKVASAYANRGRAYREKGDMDRAIADYTKAISIDRTFAAAYDNRGLAYRAKGDMDRAIADYSKAIKLDPKLADAYQNRGLAYHAKGDQDRAVHDFDEAIRLDPKLADSLKTLSAKR